jgi:hypothetical protein
MSVPMEGRIRVGLDECTVRDHVSFPSLSLRRVVRVPSIMIPFHMLLIALDVLMALRDAGAARMIHATIFR